MLRTREDIGSFQTNVEELKKELEETSHGIQTKLGSCHEKNQQWGEKFTKLEKTLQSSQSAKLNWRQARIPKNGRKITATSKCVERVSYYERGAASHWLHQSTKTSIAIQKKLVPSPRLDKSQCCQTYHLQSKSILSEEMEETSQDFQTKLDESHKKCKVPKVQN